MRDPESSLSTRDAAARLGLSVNTLRAWRHERRGPPFIAISSRKCVYRIADLDAFAEARRQNVGS